MKIENLTDLLNNDNKPDFNIEFFICSNEEIEELITKYLSIPFLIAN